MKLDLDFRRVLPYEAQDALLFNCSEGLADYGYIEFAARANGNQFMLRHGSHDRTPGALQDDGVRLHNRAVNVQTTVAIDPHCGKNWRAIGSVSILAVRVG